MVIFAFLQRKYLNICIIWNLTCMGLYVKALNPPIFGKISKDLNIICVHLHPNISVFEMYKMFNSCLCVLCGGRITVLCN